MSETRFGNLVRGQAPRIVALAGLVVLVLAVRLPNTSKLTAILNDAAHAPVFGLIALLALGFLPRMQPGRRAAAAFLLTAAIGLAVEAIQGVTGRDASWYDLLTDALGALCALGLYRWLRGRSPGRALSRASALLIALIAGAAILFPVVEAGTAYAMRAASYPKLLDLDRPLGLYFVEANGLQLDREPLPAPWNRQGDPLSLKATILGGQYPAVSLMEPYPDWQRRGALKIDVTNPGSDVLALTLRVHDRAHDNQLSDRFNRTFELDPATRVILSVPLDDIRAGPWGRALRLDQVAGLILFTSGAAAQPGGSFYVTGAWLE